MKKINTISLAIVAAIAFASCGGSKQKAAGEAEAVVTDTIENVQSADKEVVSSDTGLVVDDLTPDQTVALLLSILEKHNSAGGIDYASMRQYVDIYDIAVSLNPKDMKAAMAKAMKQHPEVDFAQTFADYRSVLRDYDDARTNGVKVERVMTVIDTITATSISEHE